jgi:hypothetical protein
MSNYKNPAAVALGRMGKGRPKTVSEDDRERRRVHMMKLNSGRSARIAERKRKSQEDREVVKNRAAVGMFTPIQPYE